jgi:mono/diheme cytochrome c family protein
MCKHVPRVVACAIIVAVAAASTRPAVAQEPTASPPAALKAAALASSDDLANAPGREKTAQCAACHSLDYIRMNSRFLDLAGWTAVVNKMINAFGAPIPKDDVDAIARYLEEHYGRPPATL